MTDLLVAPETGLVLPVDFDRVLVVPGGAVVHAAEDRPRFVPLVAGGAVTASGMFVPTFLDMWDGSDLVLDWVNDTIKYALFTNSITPAFNTDTAYGSAPYNANQVTGTGYTAGGATLGSRTCTQSPTGTVMFDAADASWTTATFSGARAGLIWDDTVTTPVADPVFGLHNFGADFAVTAGTFTVIFAATGLATIDLTP